MKRVGIVGCGAIARQRHAHEYHLHPDVEIAGFYDLSPARASEMAETFGGQVYQTREEMFADPSVDAVSICVANIYHASYTIEALNAGKHVLCEKPMATTLEECEAMLEAAGKNKKRLMIGQNQRLLSAHTHTKQILSQGDLGRVITFQSTFGHKGPEVWCVDKSPDTWFFKKELAAFGSLADLGIHKIDLMCYLIGSKVTSVYSRLATLDKKFPDGRPIEVDDNSVQILTFANGAMGTVTTSWTHYGEECNASALYCENGILRMYSNPKYTLEVTYKDGGYVPYELDSIQTNEDEQQTSSRVIDVFIEGIQTNQPTVLDAEQIIESMKVVFACLESASTGRLVSLGL